MPNKLLVERMKDKILGKDFSLSMAFVSDKRMRELNKTYRNIDKTTDILSFNLNKDSGEILFSKKESAKKAAGYKLNVKSYLSFLLIHGLLHLKGMEHSSKMERQEKILCDFFQIKHPHYLNELKNNSRNRHRNLSGKSSGSRARRKK